MESVKTKEQNTFKAIGEVMGYKNIMQAPKLEKVVVSVGVGKIRADKRKLEVIEDRLAKITGQKAIVAPAKKSIAQFKVREGETAGYKTNLSGPRMYQFLDKLINIAIPRTKDFRGINRTSVDEVGNLTIGVKEHIIFPETGDEEIRDIFGLAITVVSGARTQEEGVAFFEHLGFPFKKVEVEEA